MKFGSFEIFEISEVRNVYNFITSQESLFWLVGGWTYAKQQGKRSSWDPQYTTPLDVSLRYREPQPSLVHPQPTIISSKMLRSVGGRSRSHRTTQATADRYMVTSN